MTILSLSEQVLLGVFSAILLGWALYRIVERVRQSEFAAAVEALTDRPAALPLDGPWHRDLTRKISLNTLPEQQIAELAARTERLDQQAAKDEARHLMLVVGCSSRRIH